MIRREGVTRIWSRTPKDVSESFPELVAALDERVGGTDFVLDGEIVAYDGERTSFTTLQHRLRVTDPERIAQIGVPVWLEVFDLLRFDGHDARRLPQRDRKQVLAGLAEWSGELAYVEHVEEDGMALYAQAVESGWEGVIAKRADAPYLPGRTRNWLKLKAVRAQEFVVGGFTDPQGSRSAFGALLVGYYEDGDFRYAGRVGTGFTDRVLEHLQAELRGLASASPPFVDPPDGHGMHWVRPELVVQVAYAEWTPTGRLRHPSYQGIRTDIDAAGVRRE